LSFSPDAPQAWRCWFADVLTTKDPKWQWFNALVLGLVEDTDGSPLESLEKALAEVRLWKEAAMRYTKEMSWDGPIGLYFHSYPYNSVNSLHLHIVDLSTVGPTFEKLQFKNLSIDDVLEVLEDERKVLTDSRVGQKQPQAPAAPKPAQRPPPRPFHPPNRPPEVAQVQEEQERLKNEAVKLQDENKWLLQLLEAERQKIAAASIYKAR